MNHQQLTVQVPATTANLGPAFDCLGMSLDIWNCLQVGIGERPAVFIEGHGSSNLPLDETNLIYRSCMRLFKEVGAQPPALLLNCHNQIPLERGLGSSGAAIVSGLVAANHLAGQPLSRKALLPLATEMEGHPDNVTAALLGGAQIVVQGEQGLITSEVAIPSDLRVVLYVPYGTISTNKARRVLPKRVSYGDAIFNLGRVAMLVNAFAGGRLQDLYAGTQDRLHQPYREGLFPAMKLIIKEALKAGALGAFVSGSGPTVIALARGREMSIAYEMAEAARKATVPGETLITRPSSRGVRLVEPLNKGDA